MCDKDDDIKEVRIEDFKRLINDVDKLIEILNNQSDVITKLIKEVIDLREKVNKLENKR